MPPRHYFRRSQSFEGQDDTPAVFRLWLLRLLVPLGGQREFIQPHGFNSDAIAIVIGLGHWIDTEIDLWPDTPDQQDRIGVRDEDGERLPGSYDPKRVRAELRRLHRDAEGAKQGLRLPRALRTNLDRLAALVGLSPLDVRVLEFTVMIHSDGLLLEASEWIGHLSTGKLVHSMAVVLDVPEDLLRDALATKSVLARTGLLTCMRNGADTLSSKLELLSEHFADHILSGEMDPVELLRDNVAPSPPPLLTLGDYTHIGASLEVLVPYLKHAHATRRRGVNVFVHGDPGTGKTQLARALGSDMGCEVFQVASEDADGDAVTADRRLRAFRAAQSILAERQVLIAFDEAADVFDDGDAVFGRKSTAQTRKAWVNRMLEENPVPTLWLSNDIACLDPAFVRRFDMVIELPIPPRQHRARILSEACGDLLDPPALARIAECEVLAPAVAARSAAVVRSIQNTLGIATARLAVERLIGNTLEAQGHPAILRNDPNRLPDIYDPSFLHADADLVAMADGLVRHRQGRLCLFGPSGSGKSAFARWVAQRMDVPLQVRRASDLMSKWVGGSEKNIARTFRQAEQDQALLLIDEVDGFLQDRRDARCGWEVTLVNEMLTQMESYCGVLMASTNLLAGLDPAALRRFDVKVRFDYLVAEQAWRMLTRQCTALGIAQPLPELRPHLDRLVQLTPGDFAAVVRQHRLRPIATAAGLITALAAECALKEGGRPVIGFV